MYLAALKKSYYELVILTLHQKLLYNIGYINFMTYSLSNGVNCKGKPSSRTCLTGAQTKYVCVCVCVCVCVHVNFKRMTGVFTERCICLICDRSVCVLDFPNDMSNLSSSPRGLRLLSCWEGYVLSGRGICDVIPTDRSLSECDRRTLTVRRPWPTRAVDPLKKST